VAVVHLAQVVEGTRPLRVEHAIGAALVRDLEPTLLDVDVRCAVLTHRSELDEMDVGIDLLDGVEHVQGADHVVVLRVDGMLTVDHRIGRGALLREVDDRVGPEPVDHVERGVGVGQIGDERVDRPARVLVPGPGPRVQRLDGDEALDTHLVVVLPPHEVVADRHLVTAVREMQRGRPAQVSVAAQDQGAHCVLLHPRLCASCVGRSAVLRRATPFLPCDLETIVSSA